MPIRRVVPDITTDRVEASREFYAGFLGFDIGMDLGWVTTFVSPSNPTAQVTILRGDPSSAGQPAMSIEVDDVDAVFARAVALGLTIVRPLTDEPWGVRRFFVTDPNGLVVNILSHTGAVPTG